MPEINCPNTECPRNKPHPSGKARTCGLTIMSLERQPDERWGCEYLEALTPKCEYCGSENDIQVDQCSGREVRICRDISACSLRMVENVKRKALEELNSKSSNNSRI